MTTCEVTSLYCEDFDEVVFFSFTIFIYFDELVFFSMDFIVECSFGCTSFI